jgi:hypothetical protein
MSTLLALEQRKHDLRCALVKVVTRDGKASASMRKICRKILKLEREEGYLLRRG